MNFMCLRVPRNNLAAAVVAEVCNGTRWLRQLNKLHSTSRTSSLCDTLTSSEMRVGGIALAPIWHIWHWVQALVPAVTSALPKNPDRVLPKEEMQHLNMDKFSSHAGRWWLDLKNLLDDGLRCDEACLGDCCSCCCGLRHGKRMKRQEDSLTSSNTSTLSGSDHEVRLERGGEPQ